MTRFSLADLRERRPEVAVEARTLRTCPARALVEATRDCAVAVIGAHRRRGASVRSRRAHPAAPLALPRGVLVTMARRGHAATRRTPVTRSGRIRTA
ncbi:hypothetical protein [Streptomyces sp. NPDC003635]